MTTAVTTTAPDQKGPNPFLYFLLFLPFGATQAFIMITIGYLAGRAGVSDAAISAMIATNTLPHTWKILWASVVDTVWTGRGWYISANLVSSAAIISLGFIPIAPENVSLMTGIIFVNGLATTFIGMCTESLMARLTPPAQRGAAAGWSQAGNLGGATLGGIGLLLVGEPSGLDDLLLGLHRLGAPVELTRAAHPWLPAVVIGSILLACSLVFVFVKEPPQANPRPGFLASLEELGRSIWTLLVDSTKVARLSRWNIFVFPPVLFYAISGAGILSLALCLMPIGSGGAQNLFSTMAADWHVSSTTVALVNGLVSGGASIVGCVVGGMLSDRMDKKRAYAFSGVMLALAAFALALGPRTVAMYTAGIVAYSFALGLCYAAFTGFVLDIIGHTGGATKYNLFASLANIPIYWMGIIDGAVSTAHGRTAMLWVDGLAGVAGAVVLMLIVAVLRKRRMEPTLAAA